MVTIFHGQVFSPRWIKYQMVVCRGGAVVGRQRPTPGRVVGLLGDERDSGRLVCLGLFEPGSYMP